MKKVMNKKTKVVKEPRTEYELAMYLGTGEWEIASEKKETKFRVEKNEVSEEVKPSEYSSKRNKD